LDAQKHRERERERERERCFGCYDMRECVRIKDIYREMRKRGGKSIKVLKTEPNSELGSASRARKPISSPVGLIPIIPYVG